MKSLYRFGATALFALCLPVSVALAGQVTVPVNTISAEGVGEAIGTITLKDGHHGMMVIPQLRDLPPGNHAFHIHENPDCGPGVKDGKKVAGLRAGGHFDPTGKGHGMKHGGHGKSHGTHSKPHGDLPQLIAAADGTATQSVMSDNLKVAQVRGRAILIHRYGENDPGKPKGGGPRYACGVIPK